MAAMAYSTHRGLILLGGCAHFDGRSPGRELVTSINTPAAWSASDPAITTRAAAPPALAVWWRQLDDPILDQLIDRAIIAAPDVRTAQAKLRQSRANGDLAEANRYPSLTLSGSWGWQAFSLATLGGSGSVVQALAGRLAATLFDGGRIRSQIAVQNAVQEQALVVYEKSLLTALEDVENALIPDARPPNRRAMPTRWPARSTKPAQRTFRKFWIRIAPG